MEISRDDVEGVDELENTFTFVDKGKRNYVKRIATNETKESRGNRELVTYQRPEGSRFTQR